MPEIKKHALPDTYDIHGVEIFSEGTWNGDPYNAKDIEDLVTSFGETKPFLKPYLKLGHGEKQELLEQEGLPAAGWITNLYQQGQKLLADFSNMPKKIYDLIKAKAYARVSAEIFVNATINGKLYPKTLKAVALLGGETPAVQNLNDIHALYVIEDAVRAYEKAAQTKVYETIVNHQEEVTMADKKQDPIEPDADDMKKLRDRLSKVESDYAELDKKYKALVDESTGKDKKMSELTAEVAKTAEEKRCVEINSRLDKLVADKKIVPAQREALFTMLKHASPASEKKFKVGDKEYVSEEALVLAFVEAGSSGLPTDEKSNRGSTEAKDLSVKAKEYAEKNKVTYKEALLKVSAESK